MTGGHGFIGSNLLPELDAAGHKLVLLSRSVQRARAALEASLALKRNPELLSRLEYLRWDPLDTKHSEDITAAFSAAEAVIHLAGENIAKGRWTPERKKELRESRVAVTQALVEALTPATRIFLCASAVGIYPLMDKHQQPHSPMKNSDESYFPTEVGQNRPFLEQLVIDWESAALAAQVNGRRVVRLRTGIVLGNQGFLAELAPLYRLGLGGPIGNGRQMIPWIHVSDLARAIAWIFAHEQIQGAVNLVGPHPIAFGELSAAIASVLHRPHFVRVPELALRLALGEKSQLALSSCTALPEKLVESGFEFQFSRCEDALRDALQSLSAE